MLFVLGIMRISWTAKKSNERVLRESDSTKSLINRISKRKAMLFDHVSRREKVEHLVTTGMIEGQRSREKEYKKMLNRPTE